MMRKERMGRKRPETFEAIGVGRLSSGK